jgi:AGCS family alanine or glycine:cation symporter
MITLLVLFFLGVLYTDFMPAEASTGAGVTANEKEKEKDSTWKDTLNEKIESGLGSVNALIEDVLFFDVAFGAFEKRVYIDSAKKVYFAVDGDGQLVTHDGEVLEIVGQIVRFDDNGAPMDLAGNAVLAINPDGTVVVVQRDGKTWDIDGKEVVFEGAVNAENGPFPKALTMETSGVKVPFVILVMVFGSIFFTFWYRFINVRGFKHSIDVIRGKFDDPNDKGEISHFRALTSALSATVGLGNIAGVAIAIQMGGPGAVFWMIVTAVFGMTAKFSSCVLAQLYRTENPDGSISGGPMYYLDMGLKDLGERVNGPAWKWVGKILAVMFAFMIMGGALGGGNMFQSNQSFEAFTATLSGAYDVELVEAEDGKELTGEQVEQNEKTKASSAAKQADFKEKYSWFFGLTMAFFVGLVILGGIKRIGAATSKIVPAMCGLYVLASIFIIVSRYDQIPATFALIVSMAFTKNAIFGGAVGVMILGITRAAFSNEAGLGSAAIAHSAAKTDEPVREGIVAMIGPFIDTIIICTMTALVIIITGAWNDPSLTGQEGISVTMVAVKSVISWYPYILTGCIVLFAYSTMIAWCYYGERGWIYLMDHFGKGFGLKSVIVFRIIFVAFVFIGSILKLGAVLAFSDLMILCMAFPNIIGSIFLAPHVLKKVQNYWDRYTSGAMKPLR